MLEEGCSRLLDSERKFLILNAAHPLNKFEWRDGN